MKELRRRFTRKEKGKKKMSEYDTGQAESNQSGSESGKNGVESPRKRSKSVEKATKSTNLEFLRFTRQKNHVKRYGYNQYMVHHYAYMVKVATMPEPESYVEATKDPNWQKAMEEEMHVFTENETWDLVDVPTGVNPIGCQWVYKVKYNVNGSVNKYKAQLVAKGYMQQHVIDYNEKFVPVTKMTIVRVLLAVATAKGSHLHQMDVKKSVLTRRS